MKRQRLLWAALLCSGSALAQSSLTIFGIADASVAGYSTRSEYFDHSLSWAAEGGGLPPDGVRSIKQRQSALASHGRMGFRGTEDLGGGMAASFWLEFELNIDDGNSGMRGFNRRSTVSLSGAAGEIRLGRDYVPTFWNDSLFDPFYATGVGTNLISRVGGALTFFRGPGSNVSALDNYIRANNSISYFFPPTLGGFYGQLQYAFPEQTAHDTAYVDDKGVARPASSSQKGRYVGARFGRVSGPFDFALAYGESTGADERTWTGSAQRKIGIANLGTSYNFGAVKLQGELSHMRDRASSKMIAAADGGPLLWSGRTGEEYKGAMLAAIVPVGAGQVIASYGHVRYLGSKPALSHRSRDASVDQLALNYTYHLSKRSALYATVVRIRVRNGHNNPRILGATTSDGARGSPAYVVGGTPETSGFAPVSAMGYNVGLRHTF